METNLTFAEIIEDALHAKKMRKSALAKNIGVGKSTITKWCNGTAEPRLSQLRKLAHVLDVDFNHYFGMSNEKIPTGVKRDIVIELEKMSHQAHENILGICKLINQTEK